MASPSSAPPQAERALASEPRSADLSPQLRLRVLASLVLGLTVGSAAVGRLELTDPPLMLSDVEVEARARRLPPAAALVLGRRLPLDAPADAWAQVPGIGARTAAHIVAADLRRPSDLARVRGIGPRRAAYLSGWVRADH